MAHLSLEIDAWVRLGPWTLRYPLGALYSLYLPFLATLRIRWQRHADDAPSAAQLAETESV